MKFLTLSDTLRSFCFKISSVSILLAATCAHAQTLTGTVTNATVHKPAAGDDVILLKLGQGMEEAGRTKADAKGAFSFKLDGQGPHLVRVVHQASLTIASSPPVLPQLTFRFMTSQKKLPLSA